MGRTGGKLPPGIIEALSIGHNQDGTLSAPERMLMFSTSIGKSHYLNVVVTKVRIAVKTSIGSLTRGGKPALSNTTAS